ncbi:MAG: murein transglycosylase A [Planctomycetes bacterium]|nr:murein transglycosylase A [Planctomycetota bacterium]MBL7009407.1 murein transglycosylase A [Planctomycetota bacterium]
MRALLVVVPFLLLAACQLQPEPAPAGLDDFAIELAPGELGLVKLRPEDSPPDFSPGWYQRDELAATVLNSLSYLAAPSSRGFFPYGPITHEHMVRSLERFLELIETARSAEEFNQSIQDEFDVWMARGGQDRGDVLFTGYGRPILNGSRTRGGPFQFPLHGLPDDLVKGADGSILGRRTASGETVPYYSHRELLDNGHLEGKELVWVDDAFDAFSAHVQGSCLVELPDGSFLELGYAGKNGHEYRSVGLALVDEGRIPRSQLSLTALRQYFRDNPSEVDRVLPMNPSFVFFQKSEGGPFGCLGRQVLAMRSVATDKDVFPRAGVVFCEVRLPSIDPGGQLVQRPQRFFAADQDRGGAIRSAGRCDVFLGTGEEAMARAGHVLALGRMYYLFLRDARALG